MYNFSLGSQFKFSYFMNKTFFFFLNFVILFDAASGAKLPFWNNVSKNPRSVNDTLSSYLVLNIQ